MFEILAVDFEQIRVRTQNIIDLAKCPVFVFYQFFDVLLNVQIIEFELVNLFKKNVNHFKY